MRKEGWEKRLWELIERARESEFKFGSFDCCLFACDAIQALTGDDPARTFRGYSGELEAARVLKREGGVRAIAEVGAQEFGYQEINQLFAERGDICLAEMECCETLGVCIGSRWAFAKMPRGLAYVNLDDQRVLKVWRIE